MRTWTLAEPTDAMHDECYRRYGRSRLPCYRFRLREECGLSPSRYRNVVAGKPCSIELTNDIEAENGIWLLARLMANGEQPKELSGAAAHMRAVIAKHEQGARP